MRQIWDFHGGVHPPENKSQSTSRPIRKATLPKTLILPLSQHIGQPAKALVAPGQKVLKGEVVAAAEGPVSVAVHASSSGTVTAVERRPVPHPSGLSDVCIVIETDGEDAWTHLTPCEDYRALSPEQLLERVRQGGIAGMGGAGFPTAIKLHPPRNDKVNALILNAAECEPYITADDMLMRERADEVIRGMEIMAQLLEPEECLIGIEDNKPEAIAALQQAASGTHIEVVVIPTKYPSGGEKQLIKILTGLEVPHGKIPADIGVMCQNVGTAAAVYRAVRFGEPLISRITTVTGDGVATPGNFEVLLGAPMSDLLQQAGFDADKTDRLIMGGPMMGFSLTDLDLPLVKTSNCIMAVSAKEFPRPDPAQACIRCGLCAEACPAELLPQQLYWFSKAQEFDKAENYNLFDCIECGACSYVCPSSIPLVQYYRYAKHQIRMTVQEQQKSDKARERFEFRQARLEREKEEKEARRKARAEAAAKAQAEKAAQQQDAPADVDPKKAAIEAAIKRAQAKRSPAPVQPQVNIAELQTNVDKAREKLEKVRETLAEADGANAAMQEKLRNAIAKNEERLAVAEKAHHDAQNSAPATPAASNAAPATQATDPEQQARAIARTRDKIKTLTQAIEACRETDPQRAAQLTETMEKTKAKLAELEAESAPTDKATDKPREPNLEELTSQVDKARDKLSMMQGMLDDAKAEQPADDAKIAKLQRAVEKNQDRLAAAQKTLEEAQTQAASSGVKAASPEEIEALTSALEKAQDKLAMMQNMLNEAQQESPVDEAKVAKLSRAVEKNQDRVEAARSALNEARGDAIANQTSTDGAGA
ncbi:predicted NADH:ubiquinone oxidoreductase, subunit RnfC [Hahella chejuensis KCTC 2396]|uniref:Ion-translocating oxidoreductase complex subunit C n=1 Tax=Hahella chejuensis (strain KCTC 2396) TaxID=349521 RepID=Q2SKU6_HAHCH|nr:electron transport complex subunit RsxC [Hahella chejuensis]ABC28728.1 predicted NADH:ubiquinone oxidoreductase, subunit RnfC [Hahella chejuensis KCTC 2396]